MSSYSRPYKDMPALGSRSEINGLKVLVVEDNHHFRILLKAILNVLGVDCIEEARDGREAIRRLKAFKPDIAIIDWKMKGMNGLDCVRHIRRGDSGGDPFLPILVVTGYATVDLIRKIRVSGANECITKPISAKSLYESILEALGTRSSFVKPHGHFGLGKGKRKPRAGQAAEQLGVVPIPSPESGS
jgi:two-component system, chemotaxis family, chemotaxis protein CheY